MRGPRLRRTLWALPAAWQMPMQSRPPLVGSQSSAGLSTQVRRLGHGRPAIPPHARGFAGAARHVPMQSRPPLVGSQPSASTQVRPLGHERPAIPVTTMATANEIPCDDRTCLSWTARRCRSRRKAALGSRGREMALSTFWAAHSLGLGPPTVLVPRLATQALSRDLEECAT
jgi:hypothetical protein